jgi:hypothetical protein
MNDQKIKRLDQMLDLKWKYKGKIYYFLNYRFNGTTATVVTKEKWFDFENENQLYVFLDNCFPVPQEEIIEKPEIAQDNMGLVRANSGSGNILAYLKGILVEDIERVRENKDYVEQAKTVSNNVKRLLDTAKLELQIKALQAKNSK